MIENTDFYFQWHITNGCNNRCKHCYHADYNMQNELTREQLLQIANQIEDALEKWNFYSSMSVTGGEPFTRRDDLWALLNYVESNCVRIAHYDILTNGTLITDSDMATLKKYKKLRRIQVSLEGPNAEIHDNIRGHGDFLRVTTAIKKLKANGFTMSVMMTLTRNNMNVLPEVLELLSGLGVDYFALERFMPEGQGASNSAWTLSKQETKKVFEYMTEQAFKVKKPHLLLYRTLYCLCSEDKSVGAMCSAGVSALTILPDATLLPCRRLPIPIGNALTDGIISTWYNSKILWQLRDYSNYKGKCSGCEHFLECRGCRSMAYIFTGDYMQEDPQCWK